MSPSSRRDRIRRFYRLLLGLYPVWFRDRYGPDLLAAFDDRRREARFQGSFGGARLVLFLLRDFVTSLPLARDPGREPRTATIMGDFLRDLRYSLRMLAKNPAFTAAAVLTLALGIGLNAATFSAVNGILLRPLSGVEDPEELVQLYRSWPGLEYGSNSVPHFQDLRDRSGDVFENVAAYTFTQMSLSADGRSERIMGMLASASFFETYGAPMTTGRGFIPNVESVGAGAHPVVVLGHGFWQTRFGGDAGVVGRTVILNGRPFEVVGIAGEEFKGPVNFADTPLYVPLMMQPVIEEGNLLEQRGSNSMFVVARLRDGVDPERAGQFLASFLAGLKEELPGAYAEQVGTAMVRQNEAGIHPSFRGAQVAMSSVMMAVVGLLLLIACVNVANLFLARARERRREMGIRLSLGAGRRRIVQQLLTESLLFTGLGAAAGLALAAGATRILSNVRPPMDGPWAFQVGIDGRVLLFTLGVSVVAVVLFGMAPALQAARPDTLSAVKGESASRPGGSRASSALVVLQMALSLVLLIGSGLFLRSLQGATRIDPGFDDPSHLAMASLDPNLQGHDEARGRAIQDRVLDEIRALPQVTAAGMTTIVPLGLNNSTRGVEIPGYEFSEGERQSLGYSWVTEGYLEAMGVDLLEGRLLGREDDGAAPPVIVVNRRFAERFWPGQSAVGKVVETAGHARTVVGVVETGKYQSLGEAPTEYMYLPQRERYVSGMTLVARSATDPQAVLREVRAVVRRADADMPVFDVRTFEDHMGIALLPARLGGSVLGLFGLLGLALAAVGIYGVMAYSVAQRRRELGIRVALGADRGRVVSMVLGEGMKLALVGVVLGLGAAALASNLVAGLLYDVSALDPAAFVGVPLVLAGVAALAVWIPARRAAAADPMRALKTD